MSYNVLEVSRHIINYSSEKGDEISNLKLQKLLYFVQAAFIMERSIPCFNEKIEAWSFGPVVPKAYEEFARFGGMGIPKINFIMVRGASFWDIERIRFYDDIIESGDKEFIERVVDKFSNYSLRDLVQLTRNQTPWIEAFYYEQGNKEITLKALKKYFCG